MDSELEIVPSTAICPGCGASMVQLATTSGVAAGCRACGGIWIDNAVAMLVVTARLADDVKAFVRHIEDGAAGPAPADYRTAARRGERACPVCRKALITKPFGERATIVDLCYAHGTYFDLRELGGIVFDTEMQALERGKEDAWVAERANRRWTEAVAVLAAVVGALSDHDRNRGRWT